MKRHPWATVALFTQALRERPQTSQDEPGRGPPREDVVPWLVLVFVLFCFFAVVRGPEL